MAQPCPRCGAALPDVWDALCPSCRNELPASPPPAPETNIPPAASAPPTEPEAVTSLAPGEPTPEERVAQFWRTLNEFTPKPTVTRVLVVANLAVFVLMGVSGVNLNNPTPDDLLRWGADFGPKTLNGEWWRALSCMFVHIGFLHILMNMWVLAATGPLVERMLGNAGFLLMYLVTGLCGSLASLCFNTDIVCAGASGAVFGVYGALLGLLQRQKESVPPAALSSLKSSGLGFIGYNMVFGLVQPNIDIAAHAGGFVAGLLCGLVMSRPFTPAGVAERPARNVVTAFGGLSTVFIGLLFLSTAPPAAVELERELERCDQLDRRATDLITTERGKIARGETTDAALADAIERDILPAWRAARNRLSGLQYASRAARDHVALVLDYMRLRDDGWTLAIEAVRTGSESKALESAEKHKLANAVADKFGTR